MSNEEPPVPEEVLTSAKDKLDEDEISLADNEEILHALSELTPVYENDRSYFVLGNYDREPIRRLNLVVDRLNRRQDAYAFRMVDIRGEWDNSIQKFCLIGDIVTYLVGVAEKEPSDFLVELVLRAGEDRLGDGRLFIGHIQTLSAPCDMIYGINHRVNSV